MSASVTSRSSITNPPSSIRLWAMNWRRKSAIAGPGHATHPSASRNRRCPSRGSSASRSWSWRMNSIRERSDLAGSSRRKPVRLAHAGSAMRRNALSASNPASRGGHLLGQPERHRGARVDGTPERDQRTEALVAPVSRRLVAEHPALRVTAEMHVLPGGVCARDRRRPRPPARGRSSVRSSPPSSRSGAPKSTTQGSTPCSRRIVTALVAGETSYTSAASIIGGTSTIGGPPSAARLGSSDAGGRPAARRRPRRGRLLLGRRARRSARPRARSGRPRRGAPRARVSVLGSTGMGRTSSRTETLALARAARLQVLARAIVHLPIRPKPTGAR